MRGASSSAPLRSERWSIHLPRAVSLGGQTWLLASLGSSSVPSSRPEFRLPLAGTARLKRLVRFVPCPTTMTLLGFVMRLGPVRGVAPLIVGFAMSFRCDNSIGSWGRIGHHFLHVAFRVGFAGPGRCGCPRLKERFIRPDREKDRFDRQASWSRHTHHTSHSE
jgi:hypothetical protein